MYIRPKWEMPISLYTKRRPAAGKIKLVAVDDLKKPSIITRRNFLQASPDLLRECIKKHEVEKKVSRVWLNHNPPPSVPRNSFTQFIFHPKLLDPNFFFLLNKQDKIFLLPQKIKEFLFLLCWFFNSVNGDEENDDDVGKQKKNRVFPVSFPEFSFIILYIHVPGRRSEWSELQRNFLRQG